MRHEKFMAMALKLAKRAEGATSPNPMVGAVVVKNGKVAGVGFHKRAGTPHAEAIALDEAGRKAEGATLYVNLEPCDHFGRTPPCTDKIIKSAIKEVIIGMQDPNPINNGRGMRRLKGRGIKIIKGVLEKEAKGLNEAYIKFITKKMPFVIVKAAQSIDGKIATQSGDSKWITGPTSRKYVHKLRSQADAIMVGVNTVLRDEPLLTAREISAARQPTRIIVDSHLRTPVNAKIFSSRQVGPIILATTKAGSKNKKRLLEKKGAEVLILKGNNGRVDLRALLGELGKRDIVNLLVEGGGELIGSLVDERLADKFLFFIAPKIIGGRGAITSVEGKGALKIEDAIELEEIELKKIGTDFLIVGYPKLKA